MNSQRTSVLFDFDGVIAESYALAYDLAKKRHPHIDMPTHKKLFEGNIFEGTYGMECGPECKSEYGSFWAELLARKDEMALVPGMDAVVRDCADNHDMFIVSSTIEEAIHHILDPLKLRPLFKEILGANAGESKVAKIRSILAKYDADPAHYVFITDTLGDIREAGRLSISAIAVSWGFHDRETLMRGQPLAFVESPAALQAAIESHFMNP